MILLALLLICSAELSASDTAAEEGAALMAKARELLNIRAPESPPFRLRATVRATGTSGRSSEGSYELLWSSPTRWREEVRFPDFTQVRVGDEGKFWQKRNLEYLPPPIWDLLDTLDMRSRLQLREGEKVRKCKDRKRKNVHLRCVQLTGKDRGSRELCFAQDRGNLVREDYGAGGYEYEDYLSLEKNTFPRVIRTSGGLTRIELRVEELTHLGAVDESIFIPPPDAQPWGWCPEPKRPRRLTPHAPMDPVDHPRSEVVAYATIDVDGKLTNIKVLGSTSQAFERTMLEIWQKVRYKPQMCNGAPVATETALWEAYWIQ